MCDVGCGNGYWSRVLASKGCVVYGIDLSTQAVQTASLLFGSEHYYFTRAMAEHLPFRARVFDKVISVCVLEHIDDDLAALREMRRVIKDRGVLAMSVDSLSYSGVPHSYSIAHKRAFSVKNYYDIADLRKRMEMAGFQITDHKYIANSPFSSLHLRAWTNPYIRKLLRWLAPFTIPLSILCDTVFGDQHGGYVLAVKASPNPARANASCKA